MLKDLQIHICVQTSRKITDLKHMLVIVLLPEQFIVISLRTNTQLRFSLHFTPLGIRCPCCVSQPFACLVLENDHSRTLINPLLKVTTC